MEERTVKLKVKIKGVVLPVKKKAYWSKYGATVQTEKGKMKALAGESYIELVRFPKNGLPEIESVINYGASNHAENTNYADQMPLYLNKQTKKMTLDKAQVLKEAVKIYHPK